MTAREPPYPYGYQLALWRCWGREDEANKLLAALNTVQRGFGCPDYIMPDALPATGLTETIGDPLLKRHAA